MSPSSKKALSIGLLLLAAAALSRAEKIRNHFDSDALLQAPAFFDFLVLGAPGASDWKVTGGFNPPSAPNHVTQTVNARPADSIAVALRRNSVFQDGTWSVAIMRGRARGGIVFRMASEKDFLVLLLDAASGDARLSVYRDGRPAELAHGTAKIAEEWGFLKIDASAAKVSAQWNGAPLLEATDPRPAAGRAGMATAGPGLASFDEFVLDPAEEKR